MDALSYLNSIYGVESKQEKNIKKQENETIDSDSKTAREWNDETLRGITGGSLYQLNEAKRVKESLDPNTDLEKGVSITPPGSGIKITDNGVENIRVYEEENNPLLSNEGINILDEANLNGTLYDKEKFNARIQYEIDKIEERIQNGEIQPDIAKVEIDTLKQQMKNPDLDFIKEYVDPTAVSEAASTTNVNYALQTSTQDDKGEEYHHGMYTGFKAGLQEMKHSFLGMIYDTFGYDEGGKMEHYLTKQSDFLAGHSHEYDIGAQKLAQEIENDINKGNYFTAALKLTTKGMYYAPQIFLRSMPPMIVAGIAGTINPALGAGIITEYGLADGMQTIRDRIEENGGKDIPTWQKTLILASSVLNQAVQFGAFKFGWAGKITETAEGKIINIFDKMTGKKLATLSANDLKKVNILPKSRKVELAKNLISSSPHFIEAGVEEAGAEWIDGFYHEFATKAGTSENGDLNKVIDDAVASANLQSILGAMGGMGTAELGSAYKIIVGSILPKPNQHVINQINKKIDEALSKENGINDLKNVYVALKSEKENIGKNINYLNTIKDSGFDSVFDLQNDKNLNVSLFSRLFNASVRSLISEPTQKEMFTKLINDSISTLDKETKESVITEFQKYIEPTQQTGKIIDLEEAFRTNNDELASKIITSIIAKDPSILLSLNDYATKTNNIHLRTFVDNVINNLKSNPELNEELNEVFKIKANKIIKEYEKESKNTNTVIDYTLNAIKQKTGIDFDSNNRASNKVLPEINDSELATINFNEFADKANLEPTSTEYHTTKETLSKLHEIKTKLLDNDYIPTKKDIEEFTENVEKLKTVKFTDEKDKQDFKKALSATMSKLINKLSNIEFIDIKNDTKNKEKVKSILESLYTLEKNKHIFGSSLFDFSEDDSMLGGGSEVKSSADLEKIINSVIENVVEKVLGRQNDKLAEALNRIADILENQQQSKQDDEKIKKAFRNIIENDIKEGNIDEAVKIIYDPKQALEDENIKNKINNELDTTEKVKKYTENIKDENIKSKYEPTKSFATRHIVSAIDISNKLDKIKPEKLKKLLEILNNELIGKDKEKPGIVISDDGYAVKLLFDYFVGSDRLKAIESAINNLSDKELKNLLTNEFNKVNNILSSKEQFANYINELAKKYNTKNIQSALNVKKSSSEPTDKDNHIKSLFDINEDKNANNKETIKEDVSNKNDNIYKDIEQDINEILKNKEIIESIKTEISNIEKDDEIADNIKKEISKVEHEINDIKKEKENLIEQIKQNREKIKTVYDKFNKDFEESSSKDKNIKKFIKNDLAILLRAIKKTEDLAVTYEAMKKIRRNEKSLSEINNNIKDIMSDIDTITDLLTRTNGKTYKDIRKVTTGLYNEQYDKIQETLNKINKKIEENNCKK